MIATRLADIEDMELYFQWANDPNVRKNAFNSEYISWEDHQEWFSKKVTNDNACLYLITDNHIPIGQVRFDICDQEAEIGYSIDKKYRGQGYGKKILSAAIDSFAKTYGEVDILLAKVKGENIASKKIFIGLGFAIQDHKDGVVEYKIDLHNIY